MKKKYIFNYDFWEAEATFVVDTEKFTPVMAQETLDFFDWEEGYDNEADPVDEVLKKYAVEAIRQATINNHNERGVISDFKELEGYCSIDGSSGILLESVSRIEFSEDKLEVKTEEL